MTFMRTPRALAALSLCGLAMLGAQAGTTASAETKRFEKVAYRSATTGTERRCWVWLPATDKPPSGLPVLYALHGIGGTEDEWVDNAKPQAILDSLYAAGKIPAMIVVFPNGRAMADDRVPQDMFGPAAVAAFATNGPSAACRWAVGNR